MGFFSGYSSGSSVGGFLGGLGRLTARGGAGPSKEASRVVRAFAHGQAAQGACKGPKDARACEITSDGLKLKVGSLVLADRSIPYSPVVKVCIPAQGQIVALKSGKMVEAQESKDVKAAAGALLRSLKTGLGVRTTRGGAHRISGRHGASKVAMPGECLTININKGEMQRVGTNASATLLAKSRGILDRKTFAAAKAEILKDRDTTRRNKRLLALTMARASRASKRPGKMPAPFKPYTGSEWMPPGESAVSSARKAGRKGRGKSKK